MKTVVIKFYDHHFVTGEAMRRKLATYNCEHVNRIEWQITHEPEDTTVFLVSLLATIQLGTCEKNEIEPGIQ